MTATRYAYRGPQPSHAYYCRDVLGRARPHRTPRPSCQCDAVPDPMASDTAHARHHHADLRDLKADALAAEYAAALVLLARTAPSVPRCCRRRDRTRGWWAERLVAVAAERRRRGRA